MREMNRAKKKSRVKLGLRSQGERVRVQTLRRKQTSIGEDGAAVGARAFAGNDGEIASPSSASLFQNRRFSGLVSFLSAPFRSVPFVVPLSFRSNDACSYPND